MTTNEIHGPVRDTNLDIYRALIMIYILCVIHVGYWLNYVDEPWKSLILFEMPVIFFISGAALSVTNRRHSFKQMIIGRFKRIAIPYYIYILIVLAIAAVFSKFLPSLFRYDLNWQSAIELTSFMPIKGLSFPYLYHTWFILPYMLIYIIFWFEQRICNRMNAWLFSGLVLSICLISQFSNNSFLKTTSIYNFFFIIGYLYYKKLKLNTIFLVLILSILCVFICLLYNYQTEGVKSMQHYKFAGNIIFLFYGLAMLSLWSIIFSYLRIKPNRFLNIWNKNGYTIYLWQNFSFVIVVILAKFLPALNNILYAMILIFIISSLTCFPACFIEKVVKSALIKLIRYKTQSDDILKQV